MDTGVVKVFFWLLFSLMLLSTLSSGIVGVLGIDVCKMTEKYSGSNMPMRLAGVFSLIVGSGALLSALLLQSRCSAWQ